MKNTLLISIFLYLTGIGSTGLANGIYVHRSVVVDPRPSIIVHRPVVVAPRPIVVQPRPVVIAPRPIVAAPLAAAAITAANATPAYGTFYPVLSAGAVAITVNNIHYWHDNNVWYQKGHGGFVVVKRPY